MAPHSMPRLKNSAPKVRNNTATDQAIENGKKQPQKIKTSIENCDPSFQVMRKRVPASNPEAHNKNNRQLFRRLLL